MISLSRSVSGTWSVKKLAEILYSAVKKRIELESHLEVLGGAIQRTEEFIVYGARGRPTGEFPPSWGVNIPSPD